jgi:hypothetical protein
MQLHSELVKFSTCGSAAQSCMSSKDESAAPRVVKSAPSCLESIRWDEWKLPNPSTTRCHHTASRFKRFFLWNNKEDCISQLQSQGTVLKQSRPYSLLSCSPLQAALGHRLTWCSYPPKPPPKPRFGHSADYLKASNPHWAPLLPPGFASVGINQEDFSFRLSMWDFKCLLWKKERWNVILWNWYQLVEMYQPSQHDLRFLVWRIAVALPTCVTDIVYRDVDW